MYRIIISILCIYSSLGFAGTGRSGYMDLNKFMDPSADNFNDIAYTHIVPQYEEKLDPKKAVAIEFFFGEFDGSEKSLRNLAHIKDIISDDKRTQKNYKSTVISMSDNSDISKSSEFQKVIHAAGLTDNKVHTEDIPYFVKKRRPSSFKAGRKFWTFIRFSSTMAGTFGAFYFLDGLSAPLAASVAFWPGLASGGITYFSNGFGAFLTDGKWSNWLLESDSFMAKKFRAGFKLNPVTFEDALIKNQEYFKVKYPEMYKKNKNLFNTRVERKTHTKIFDSKSRLTSFISKLHNIEEYFKWWVTEVAFVGAAIKLPQAIAGVGGGLTLSGVTSDILIGSTMGMVAQGPGDIAIQVRKYQMVEELREKVKTGSIKVENSTELLEEIEKVLAKTGEHKGYVIHEGTSKIAGSHKALIKIENWARSRATMLSFFSVTGVALEIAGIPAGKPILIAIGLFGAGYYANVQGWIKPSNLKKSVQNFIAKVRAGDFGFSMQFLKVRWCSAKFQYGKNSLVTP